MQRTFVCVMLMAVGAMWQSPCNLAPRDAGSRDPGVGRGGPKVHGAAQPSASLERVMHFIRSQLIVNKAFKRIAGHCDCVSTAVIGSGMARVASQTQL